ncbi:MAG: exodeoxyribonuclease I [Proteobacteria bacterium]|nr:exodeoxyribonuclease I [Pseudomonadota bacterium]
MKTLLFYDVETSGLNPAFDQILTFACIRTDLGLAPISRESVTIKLRRDIVPSPHAFITHCLTPDELDCGITEYQAAVKIHKLVNTPGTISVGYNSLGFDDVFLRFLFYRNLLDPYSHQYANQCSRMDLLPVTTLFYVFCGHVLQWPHQENGNPSLKLELLSHENKFVTSGRAHEAMNDVEAVIELCRIFSQQKEIWAYALAFFNKTKDTLRINSLEKKCKIDNFVFRICLMVSASFGAKNNFIAPVIHVGESVPYKNQSLWIRLDTEDAWRSDEESDIYDLFVIRKRPGDELIVLPFLERFKARLTPGSHERLKGNLERIQSSPERFLKTIQYHRNYQYPIVPNIDPDAALYQAGFFSTLEKKEINRFHGAEDSKKAIACASFTSARVKELSNRILLRNFPAGFLSPDLATREYKDHLRLLASLNPQEKIVDFRGDPKHGCAQAMADLKELQTGDKAFTPLQKKILAWLKAYVENLIVLGAEPF